MNWTSGYRADIDYTYGYYGELAPGMQEFALLMSGHEPPARAGMRYLELGRASGLFKGNAPDANLIVVAPKYTGNFTNNVVVHNSFFKKIKQK